MRADPRAKGLWKKFTQCYGTRFTETYGDAPTDLWCDALEDLTDAQIAYGFRIVQKQTPVHPPTLPQFVQAAKSMPVAQQTSSGPNIQTQLCQYASMGLSADLFARPWTYLYREWWDDTRPKGFERCVECTGVVIDLGNDTTATFTVAQMLEDTERHARVMRYFGPQPYPTERQMQVYRASKNPSPNEAARLDERSRLR